MCGASVAAVCGVWARACARVVGGVCLAIARRHVSVVVIIRTREALQIRERADPSVDTNGRRGDSAVVRCGWSSAVCWGATRMLVRIVGRLCWVRFFRAKERVGPKAQGRGGPAMEWGAHCRCLVYLRRRRTRML